ncbi:hypothetical protein LXL04_015013 [Taraxacum kok-saghyz]
MYQPLAKSSSLSVALTLITSAISVSSDRKEQIEKVEEKQRLQQEFPLSGNRTNREGKRMMITPLVWAIFVSSVSQKHRLKKTAITWPIDLEA